MSPNEELTYESISQLFQKERKVSRLTDLEPEFYDEVANYLSKLESEYENEVLKNPTSPTTMLLREEHIKITRLLKQIYEIRERKIVLSALSQVKGVMQEMVNVTPKEKELRDAVIEILTRSRTPILQVSKNAQVNLETGSLTRATKSAPTTSTMEAPNNFDTPEPEPTSELIEAGPDIDTPPVSEVPPQEADPPEPEPPQEPSVSHENEMVDRSRDSVDNNSVVAVVLEDISSFIGTDLKTYNLKSEDVVTLPKDIAAILMKNNKIKLIE